MKKGKVYIAGAGPGDEKLITLKCLDILKKSEVIVYDRLISDKLKELNKSAEKIYVGKENTDGGESQNDINETLYKKALEGKIVLRLKGGDPFVFGRGAEEWEYLLERGIDVSIIPGLTSSIAVPELAGIPLTHRGKSSSFHIFTGHFKDDEKEIDYKIISKLEGTLVFLMGIKNSKKISENLIKNGKNPKTPIAIIQNGSTLKEKVVFSQLESLYDTIVQNKIEAPSVIVIGEAVEIGIKLYKSIEKKRKVLITRAEADGIEFSEKLELNGFNSVISSFLEIKNKKIDLSKINLNKYKAILFNSINGVRSFMEQIEDIRVLSNCKIGVVGEKTYEELCKYKIKADFVPKKYLTDLIIEKAVESTNENEDILVVTSNLSNIDIGDISRKYKRNFEKIETYETIKIEKTYEEIKNIFENSIDIITFLSSSAVESFMDNIKKYDFNNLNQFKIASIGPVTSKTLEKYGIKADITADIFTVEGLIEKIQILK